MIDLKKLDKITDELAAYAALAKVHQLSYTVAQTPEEERTREYSIFLSVGYAMGRLSKKLERDGLGGAGLTEFLEKMSLDEADT